jgi:Flp pilus assembly protein TadG
MKTKMMIRDQNGGAAVEFAIILPLLIALLFGIVEFGLLLYNKQIITNASREGARDSCSGPKINGCGYSDGN